ncbi:MAG: hydrogenase formation protein HypD [Phycisphaerae bacterium]|nr:hydrogenase formation protein HypD [Phycisphaerae bacterium]
MNLNTIQKAQAAIKAACDKVGRRIHVMEVCGTHTVSIFRSGVRSILPEGVKLLSGPGCPVCVTDQGYIDVVIELADRDDCLIATYGDMIRVPGQDGSLESRQARARIVLSADDALQLARANPDKTVVFVAVGFETTTPATAVVVQDAARQGIKNFCVLCAHKLVVPAMQTLLSARNDRIDAFLCPGHVSVIIGYEAYAPVVDQYKRPCVVAGFEPAGIMEAMAEICEQVARGKPELKSMYQAVVTARGNAKAQALVAECFDVTDAYWRGIGKIEQSGLELKPRYEAFDAFKRFGITEIPGQCNTGCRCGEVLCGLIDPKDCGLFGRACTPQSPVGPCMVSSEGACAAWYKYGS